VPSEDSNRPPSACKAAVLPTKPEPLCQDQMLEKKIISPSRSPYASLIVLVIKKDGSARFAIDYRKLNDQTKRDRLPLPRIEETLHALGGFMFYSTLDLAGGFHQIKVRDQDSDFISHQGLTNLT
jgi:hypothetical protein